LADSAGAERAVSTALALLLARGRSGAGGYAEVALAAVAWDFAAPLRHGLTRPGGLLGGGLPSYGLYRAADGWLALAALEQAFQQQLSRTLDLPALTQEALAAVFRTRPAAEWAAWAADHGLPLVVLPGMPPEA
ncbi:MAG TPA: CoA transferase, partial [Chloroflexia bacterium]|nr:CoA transferase [Chloroflexia bacterium]